MRKARFMTPLGSNPYVTGNSVGDSDAFCGRQDILNAVHQILQSPLDQAIILYGQRRIGKTSVLRRLEMTLSNDNYLPIFFDLEGKVNLSVEKILQDLANEISRKLEEDEPKIVKCDDFLNWLEKRIIPQQLTTNNRRLVLLLDECDMLKDGQFFHYLQSSEKKFASLIKLVFALARPVNRLPQSQSNWFRKVTGVQAISLLNKENTQEIISLSEKNKTLQWSNDARDKIWQLTNGHPFIIQNLCSKVWHHIRGSRKSDFRGETLPPMATHEQVEKVIHETLTAIEPGLDTAWKQLSIKTQLFAFRLAQISGNDSSSKLTLTKRERIAAISELKEEDWINEETETYSFKVELARQWIAQKSYDELQQEWESLNPEDKNNFSHAKVDYEDKNWPKVINLLKPIIENTPSHLTAKKMLAEAFFYTDQFEEAKKHFEELYKRKPDDVRPWLINTLKKLASKTTDEDEKEKFYSQILKTDKEHPEAKSWLQEHWKQRGDEAYQQGKLEEAEDYYRKANLKDKLKEVQQRIHQKQGDEAYRKGDLESALNFFREINRPDKVTEITHTLNLKELLQAMKESVHKPIETILVNLEYGQIIFDSTNYTSQKTNIPIFIKLLKGYQKKLEFVFSDEQMKYIILQYSSKLINIYFLDHVSPSLAICLVADMKDYKWGNFILECEKIVSSLIKKMN